MKPLFRNTISSLIVALALPLAVSSIATAQQAPATAPAAAAQPVLSESHLAIAREVVSSSGLGKSFEGMIPQIADQIRSGISRTRPELIRDMEETLKPIIADLGKQSDQMITASARLYALRMSENELKDIAAFFKSASGQKYVSSQGQIMNDLFTEMQVFSQTLGNIMMDRVREEMRKKGHQL